MTPPPVRSASRVWTAVLVVVAALVGAALGAFLGTPGGSTDARALRLMNPIQVTSAIGVESYPTWSPEGGRIAYMSDQTGNEDIWVSQVTGGTAVNLTEDFAGRDLEPSWSPDGGQIAFKSDRDGGGCFVMSALGGAPRRVASVAITWGGPAWSSDGSRLACPGIDEASRGFIDIVTMTSQEVERLDLDTQYWPIEVSWSPDGEYFAYVDAMNPAAQTSRLWIVSLSGQSIALTDGTTEAWSPVWFDDGESLVYVSNRGGTKDLWMQKLSDSAQPQGDPKPITTGLDIRTVVFLADGSRIAYSRSEEFANAWRVPILPDRPATWSDAEQLTFDQAFVEHLALSPEGDRLVVSSDRNGSDDLWTLPTEGGEMQRLTSDPAPDWAPSWSPDGKEIAFYSARSGNRDIFVMPSDGGPARQLTTHEGGDIFPVWSPDGQHIAYTSIVEGNYDIWVVSATGEDPRRLTDYGGFENVASWSPDGQWIAFASDRDSDDGASHVWLVAATGGEPEQVTKQDSHLPRWSPDGTSIYYQGPFGSNEYWAITMQDRHERLVADLSEKAGRQGNYALATDGEYLYFTWQEAFGDIWVMDVVTDED